MTTPRDLVIITMDMSTTRPVERGDLSLALAGAELVDLLRGEVVQLERDRIVPGEQPAALPPPPQERGAHPQPASDHDGGPSRHPVAMDDRLLDEAAASLVRQKPYERVGDWLWRRGRGLAEGYLAVLEAEGQAVRQQRRRWLVLRTSQLVLVDSPERRTAANRWAAQEPVLATLAAGIGIPGDSDEEKEGAEGAERTAAEDLPSVTDDAVATVLAAVDDALQELSAERQRRARRRDEATANNVRRGY